MCLNVTSPLLKLGVLKLSPVIMTRAVRQEKEETSSFMRWRAWENSKMESIQSPKPRTHCILWSTAPLQKISLSVSGLELEKKKATWFVISSKASGVLRVRCMIMINDETQLPKSFWNVLQEAPLTDTQDAGWRVQQTQIPAAVPGLLSRTQRNLGCSSPTSWWPPWRLWVSRKTVWCHLRPLSGSDWLLSRHTGIADSRERSSRW